MCVTGEDVARIIAISIDILTGFFWVYLVIVLRNNKHKLLFVKRGPILLQAYVYLSFAHVVFFEPMLSIGNLSCVPEEVKGYILYIVFTFWYMTLEIHHTIFALRFLLHYAKIQRSESVNNKTDNNMSFIVKYYHIFGNPSKLFMICLITTLIQSIMIIVIIISVGFPMSYKNAREVNIWTARGLLPFWMIRFFITIYCFIKSRKFKDYWLITQEFKYLIMSLLIVTTVFIFVACGMTAVLQYIPLSSGASIIILSYTVAIIYSFWALISSYISVVWVNKMDDKLFNVQFENDNTIQNETSPKSIPLSGAPIVTIIDVLNDKQCM